MVVWDEKSVDHQSYYDPTPDYMAIHQTVSLKTTNVNLGGPKGQVRLSQRHKD